MARISSAWRKFSTCASNPFASYKLAPRCLSSARRFSRQKEIRRGRAAGQNNSLRDRLENLFAKCRYRESAGADDKAGAATTASVFVAVLQGRYRFWRRCPRAGDRPKLAPPSLNNG